MVEFVGTVTGPLVDPLIAGSQLVDLDAHLGLWIHDGRSFLRMVAKAFACDCTASP